MESRCREDRILSITFHLVHPDGENDGYLDGFDGDDDFEDQLDFARVDLYSEAIAHWIGSFQAPEDGYREMRSSGCNLMEAFTDEAAELFTGNIREIRGGASISVVTKVCGRGLGDLGGLPMRGAAEAGVGPVGAWIRPRAGQVKAGRARCPRRGPMS